MKIRISPSVVAGVSLLSIAGMVVAPAAFAVTGTTTVNANISAVISIATSGTVNLAITPVSGGSATSASDTVTVTTNNSTGYNLKINGATTTLANGANTIAANAGTIAAPAAITNNTWGFRIDDATATTGFGNTTTTAQTNVASLTSTKWAAMPTTATLIKTTSAAATSGDATTVWYGAMADTSKPSGTYSDVITYTATTNP